MAKVRNENRSTPGVAVDAEYAPDETVMQAIRCDIEAIESTISTLGHRTERIAVAARLIDEIADRTTLLALNARILAAQAGSHGRGIAAVADQIRELSERTARSADAIQEMLEDVHASLAELSKFLREEERQFEQPD